MRYLSISHYLPLILAGPLALILALVALHRIKVLGTVMVFNFFVSTADAAEAFGGVPSAPGALNGWGLSAQWRDHDLDGDPDLYVCNDFHTPDRMWIKERTCFEPRFGMRPRACAVGRNLKRRRKRICRVILVAPFLERIEQWIFH